MEGVAGIVSVREDKRLLALSLSPPVDEQGSVPIDFVEDVRGVDVAGRTVGLAGRCAGAGGPGHVVLVVVETGGRVVAGREVDVRAERGGEGVAVHIREAGTCALVTGVLHPNAVHAVRVSWVGWDIVVGARAGELHRLDGA